ncbi:beta-1,4-mannooligosaccharide phosphorylase [bacterium BMS3Abin05]|nr:beta-1,4-mannooligosaccharide phosphorylase [bacterium BMS3Abin05]
MTELFTRYEKNPILKPEQWPYPVNTVFNAGAAKMNGETVLLVRVEDKTGISHLNTARSKNGISDWRISEKPSFAADPQNYPEEHWGVEDPRLTYLDEFGSYFIVYTAYSAEGPLVSLAKTDDFIAFERLGPILLPENKDAALFPRKFGNRWALLHRPVQASRAAHIWISFSPDLKHWGDHRVVIRAREGAWWDANKIGLGPQPVETEMGWLIIYHGVQLKASGSSIYRLGLALLDPADPGKVICRSNEWVFGPKENYEHDGDVRDVTFPCGVIYDKASDELRVYYGAADTAIALATAKMRDILTYLKSCK